METLYGCRLCKEDKPGDAFSPAQLFPKKGKPNMSCRKCRAVYTQRWRKSGGARKAKTKFRTSEKGRESTRIYRASPESKETTRINRLKRKWFGVDSRPMRDDENLKVWMTEQGRFGIRIKQGIPLPPKLAALREILAHDERVKSRAIARDEETRVELKSLLQEAGANEPGPISNSTGEAAEPVKAMADADTDTFSFPEDSL